MILSILCIYAFVLLGVFAKQFFKDEMNERSFVLLSIYFLQPILAFWGLSSKPLTTELIQAPMWFLAFSLITLLLAYASASLFFTDAKDRSIVTAGTLIGNTGNLGIPLGIAIFGEASVIYTSLMNFANFFVLYFIGVFLYSKGHYSIKKSVTNIFRLPVVWAAMGALLLNGWGITIHEAVFRSLEMGAYAAMVLQLMIFGMYLSQIKLAHINYRLLVHVNLLKYIILPALFIPLLLWLNFPPLLMGVLLLELSVPLAINNINFASLYHCKPLDVTTLVFVSSFIFIGYLVAMVWILKYLGKL